MVVSSQSRQVVAPVVPRLQLLGVPRFFAADGTAVALGPRLAPLVALVALGGAELRSDVAALMYPQLDPAEARRNLRQLIHKQRALLGEVIEHAGERMQLRAGLHVDALASGEVSLDRPALLLGEQRYDMPQLQTWLDGQRELRFAAWLDAIAALSGLDEREGRIAEALFAAERLAHEQPTSEHAHRRVMRLQYLRGDRAAALASFDRCERVLKDELGVRPGSETLTLLAQIEKAEFAPSRTILRVPPTVLRPPVLIGREAEWRALNEAWAAGQTVAVTGQGGLGKTRLLTDFVRAMGDDGQRMLIVPARPGDEKLPQAVLTRLLRGVLARRVGEVAPGIRQELASLLPEFGESDLIARRDAARFVNAVQSLIGDAVEAGLEAVVLDDLQYADDASLEIAQHLATQSQLRWILAFRDVELSDAGKNLVAALAESTTQCTVALTPLDRADVHRLIASLGVPELDADTWADAMHRRTGGNPLYLLETIKVFLVQPRAGVASSTHISPLARLPVASNVSALIARRITQLSPAAVRIARCAAIAGQDFSAALATKVLVAEPLDLADGWAELEAAQVLRDGAFAHDLIYEAALASVPVPLASELHAKIAHFLVSARAAAVRIAPHAEAGALHDLAARSWQQSGEESERAGRLVEAGRHFCLAARNFECAGSTDLAFKAYVNQAHVITMHGYDVPVDELLAKLSGLARSSAERAEAACVRSAHFLGRGLHDAALSAGLEAMALLRTQPDPALHLRAACVTANAHCMREEPLEALNVLLQCEVWVRSHANTHDRADYENLVGFACTKAGRLRESLVHYSTAADILRSAKRPRDLAMILTTMGNSYYEMGDVERGLELVHQSVSLETDNLDGARSLGLLQMEYTGARYCFQLGRYGDAIEMLEKLVGEFDRHGAASWSAICELYLGFCFLRLGQFARATRLLASESPELAKVHRPLLLCARYELNLAQATAPIDALVRECKELDSCLSGAPLHAANLWRCRLVSPALAVALLNDVVSWASANDRQGHRLGAHVRAAEFALSGGDASLAASHARAALELGEGHHAPMQYRGDLYLQAGRALDAAGEPRAASQAVEMGIDWLRTTLTQIPSEFRPSFLGRNPTNVQLLTLARRMGTVALGV